MVRVGKPATSDEATLSPSAKVALGLVIKALAPDWPALRDLASTYMLEVDAKPLDLVTELAGMAAAAFKLFCDDHDLDPALCVRHFLLKAALQ